MSTRCPIGRSMPLALLLVSAMAQGAAPDAVRERLLHFIPLDDGREAVIDARTQGLVRMLKPMENTFLTITIRGLQHNRLTHGLDRSQPYKVAFDPERGFTLEDPLTHESMILRAFGSAAVAGIAPLLTAPAQALSSQPVACTRLDC